MINEVITFTKISRKIRLTILARVYYLWAPKSQQISHTFNVFVFYDRSLILSLYEPSSVPSHYQHCPHGIASYHQLTMTQNFLCFFLLDILFHFCFALSSSSYINMCLHVHIHHSQFLVLCFIQSLLEGL